jgi:NADPH2:quinone reductase
MQAYRMIADGAEPAWVEMPEPRPGEGEIGVRIAACGLNFADLLMIRGEYQERPALPFTLGLELAGTVTEVGAGVSDFRPGDRVAVFAGSGGLAEAGAFRAALQPGETLLVLGAAGGVGLTAVEIGKAMGARVIAAARGADKLAVARLAGADHLIDTDRDDLRDSVKALGGADVVYDPVGGALFTAALRACKPKARIVVIGFASGNVPQIPANILLVKNITVIGFYWGGYLAFDPGRLRASLSHLLEWRAEGRIRPHLSQVLPRERAAEGLALLRDRKTTGKVVIRI